MSRPVSFDPLIKEEDGGYKEEDSYGSTDSKLSLVSGAAKNWICEQ